MCYLVSNRVVLVTSINLEVALIGVPAVGCRILSLIILSIATLASASDTATLTCGNCNLAVLFKFVLKQVLKSLTCRIPPFLIFKLN